MKSECVSSCSVSHRKRSRSATTKCQNNKSSSSSLWTILSFAAFSSSVAAHYEGPATKPLVRGQEPPPSALRNQQQPLRTATGRNTRGTGTAAAAQPTRNVGLVEEVDAARVLFHRQSEAFLGWCYRTFNIDSSLVTIEMFEYHDYIQAMEDRIDIFCEDCYYGEEEMSDEEHGWMMYDSNHNDIMYDDDDDFISLEEDDEDRFLSVTDYPTVPVRGLAAKKDIEVGQVVLAIPHHALWTLSNIVDQDPVLSKVMGKEARETMGWDTQMDEIPLLAVALLYQLQQVQQKQDAEAESKYGPYLQMLQDQKHDLQRSIPHLWSSAKLRKKATPEVRKVAKGIQRDVLEMYEMIVMVLVEEHPNVFGEPYEAPIDEESTEDGTPHDDDWNLTKQQHHRRLHHDSNFINENGEEWMFSLEKFHWAFALINSRHWHLPVPETDDPVSSEQHAEETEQDVDDGPSPSTNSNTDDNISFNDQPPASMPTEEWMKHQREEHRKEEERESRSEGETEEFLEHHHAIPPASSFLAPVADLLNFGPPCTKGRYNYTTHVFEIVATCSFRKGQEITFWYTDACEDVFMANYGFTMPMMVPKCATLKDEATAKVKHLVQDLSVAYQELDRMDSQVDELLTVLHECHCENQTDLLAGRKINTERGKSPPKAPSPPTGSSRKGRNSGPKGGSRNDARHAIRGRTRRSSKEGNRVRSRKSEF